MEDYLERIYQLIDEKGYARVSDIAEGLEVHPSSVTKMIQKLDKDDYLVYEKYRGLILTPKGKKVGKRLVDRHQLLEQFLDMIGVDKDLIYKDVEGIEHHLSWIPSPVSKHWLSIFVGMKIACASFMTYTRN